MIVQKNTGGGNPLLLPCWSGVWAKTTDAAASENRLIHLRQRIAGGAVEQECHGSLSVVA